MQGILNRTNLFLMGLFVAVLVAFMAVPAFAQTSDLGDVAQTAATGAVGKAALVAGVVIGFAILYKLVRRVTG